MARIEIDPNYTSPTFSRATAAADIFKKEDVQALAAAMSTHDHAATRGVAVAGVAPNSITSAMIATGTVTGGPGGDIATTTVTGGAAGNIAIGTVTGGPGGNLAAVTVTGGVTGNIAIGSVTTENILDGSLTAADLALNAITQAGGSQALGTFGGSGGSTNSTTFVDVTPPSSITLVLRGGYGLLLMVSGAVALSSAAAAATLGLKVDGAAPVLVKRIAPLVANTATPFMLMGMYGGTSGSHTFQLSWNVSAGTVSMDGSSSMVMYAIEFLR